jgi:hypothetical protein
MLLLGFTPTIHYQIRKTLGDPRMMNIHNMAFFSLHYIFSVYSFHVMCNYFYLVEVICSFTMYQALNYFTGDDSYKLFKLCEQSETYDHSLNKLKKSSLKVFAAISVPSLVMSALRNYTDTYYLGFWIFSISSLNIIIWNCILLSFSNIIWMLMEFHRNKLHAFVTFSCSFSLLLYLLA